MFEEFIINNGCEKKEVCGYKDKDRVEKYGSYRRGQIDTIESVEKFIKGNLIIKTIIIIKLYNYCTLWIRCKSKICS